MRSAGKVIGQVSIFRGRREPFGTFSVVWNDGLRGSCRTSDTLSSARQAWYFAHVAKLKHWQPRIKMRGASKCRFFGAGVIFGEFGRWFERLESRFVKLTSVLLVAWSSLCRAGAQLGMPEAHLRGRCSTSETSRKKGLRRG